MTGHPNPDPSGVEKADFRSDSTWIEEDPGLMTALRAAVNLHAVVAITDRQGTILHVNDRFCEKSGYRADELIASDPRVYVLESESELF